MPKGQRNWSKRERFENLYQHNWDNGCWEWIGGKNNLGYGMFRDGNKMRTAHRVGYEIFNNTKIPKNICVCHTCDNPKCVNPKHLWLGTIKENITDMIDKGRANFRGFPKGKHQPRRECKYCKNIFAANIIGLYHNEKCKFKQVAINTTCTNIANN